VARGYAVLRPNPRGSTGRGAAFAEAVAGDVGGLDVDDVVSGVEHLVRAGVADAARLGITGISYGGYLASWVPCRSDLFSAAVARSPATDMVSQHLTSNIAEFDTLFVQGDPFDPASAYTTRSPLWQHTRNRTPTLLTAGLLDLATPPSQAQVLYSALAGRGVPAGLVLYPEEGHGVRQPEAVADQVARMVAWFEHFMPARPA
jgi:dipeptidyl aminopeptidase/acylaminoacyl peptidase